MLFLYCFYIFYKYIICIKIKRKQAKIFSLLAFIQINYPTAPFSLSPSCSFCSSDCSDSELSDSETSGDGVSCDSELSGDSLSLDSEEPGLGFIMSPISGNPGNGLNGLLGSVGSVLSSGGAGGLMCS